MIESPGGTVRSMALLFLPSPYDESFHFEVNYEKLYGSNLIGCRVMMNSTGTITLHSHVRLTRLLN
jgi:hypothetical protein